MLKREEKIEELKLFMKNHEPTVLRFEEVDHYLKDFMLPLPPRHDAVYKIIQMAESSYEVATKTKLDLYIYDKSCLATEIMLEFCNGER